MSWSSDGHQVAAGGADGIVRIWVADELEATREVCASAGAPMTPQEWRRYVTDVPYRTPC